MQHSKGHEESGVQCDMWVQRLESSKSFKNKSTVISYIQWKKYVSFAKRLNERWKKGNS
jgi:hypothetical protein